jgi:ABC-2 type transport system permease protein
MTELLHAELIKLRTTRTFATLAIISVVVSAAIAVVVSIMTEPTREDVVIEVFSADLSSVFILMLAVIGISGEWRHRTITSSLLAAPDRGRFLLAKTFAYAVAGMVLSILTALAVAVVGTVILTVRDLPLPELGELLAQWGRNGVLAALLAAFGIGIGGLLRNQLVGIVALLLMMFVIEPMVLGFAPDIGRFGPLGALSASAAGLPGEEIGLDDVQLLGVWASVGALLAWIGVVLGGTFVTLVRRDLE